jgi:hypothetical protein
LKNGGLEALGWAVLIHFNPLAAKSIADLKALSMAHIVNNLWTQHVAIAVYTA